MLYIGIFFLRVKQILISSGRQINFLIKVTFLAILPLKGIVQPFELGGVTSLIRSAVKFCKAGHFQENFLMIQSHERSLKQNSAA